MLICNHRINLFSEQKQVIHHEWLKRFQALSFNIWICPSLILILDDYCQNRSLFFQQCKFPSQVRNNKMTLVEAVWLNPCWANDQSKTVFCIKRDVHTYKTSDFILSWSQGNYMANSVVPKSAVELELCLSIVSYVVNENFQSNVLEMFMKRKPYSI